MNLMKIGYKMLNETFEAPIAQRSDKVAQVFANWAKSVPHLWSPQCQTEANPKIQSEESKKISRKDPSIETALVAQSLNHTQRSQIAKSDDPQIDHPQSSTMNQKHLHWHKSVAFGTPIDSSSFRLMFWKLFIIWPCGWSRPATG